MTFDEALPHLVTAYEQGRLVPFLGSGMSSGVCRGWRDFILELAKIAKTKGIQNLDELIDAKDLRVSRYQQWLVYNEGELTAARIKEAKGDTNGDDARNRLADLMEKHREALRPKPPDPDADLALAAHRIVSLLKRFDPKGFIGAMRNAVYIDPDKLHDPLDNVAAFNQISWPLVLTTNYDDLLLRWPYKKDKYRDFWVCGRSLRDCGQVVASLNVPAPSILWALQGFLPLQNWTPTAELQPHARESLRRPGQERDLAEQLVIGHQEYRSVTHREPWFRRAFAEVFHSRSLLYIGSGLEPYLLELFGEVIEMVGMPPFPHFAILQKGAKDSAALRERFNIIALEYDDPSHKMVAQWLGKLAGTLEAKRIITTVLGYSFDSPGNTPRAHRDMATFSLVRGVPRSLPEPPDGERRLELIDRDSKPAGITQETQWLTYPGEEDDERHDAPRCAICALIARQPKAHPVSGEPVVEWRLRQIRKGCCSYLKEAEEQGFMVARVILPTRGEVDYAGFLHTAVQIACGVRDWYMRDRKKEDRPRDDLRVVVHVDHVRIWFNIASGRLNLADLLRNADTRVITVVENPDGTASRHYRTLTETDQKSKQDTLRALAEELHVPLEGWAADLVFYPDANWHCVSLKDDEAKTSLLELGIVPGSTVRFFPVVKLECEPTENDGAQPIPWPLHSECTVKMLVDDLRSAIEQKMLADDLRFAIEQLNRVEIRDPGEGGKPLRVIKKDCFDSSLRNLGAIPGSRIRLVHRSDHKAR